MLLGTEVGGGIGLHGVSILRKGGEVTLVVMLRLWGEVGMRIIFNPPTHGPYFVVD